MLGIWLTVRSCFVVLSRKSVIRWTAKVTYGGAGIFTEDCSRALKGVEAICCGSAIKQLVVHTLLPARVFKSTG